MLQEKTERNPMGNVIAYWNDREIKKKTTVDTRAPPPDSNSIGVVWNLGTSVLKTPQILLMCRQDEEPLLSQVGLELRSSGF